MSHQPTGLNLLHKYGLIYMLFHVVPMSCMLVFSHFQGDDVDEIVSACKVALGLGRQSKHL